MQRLLILGAGGFGRCVAELAALSLEYGCVSFLDDNAVGEDIIGRLEDFERCADDFDAFFVAFGNNALRLSWTQKLVCAGKHLPVLVHPTAFLSPSARLGAGSILLPGSVVHANVSGGQAVLINCNAVVDHDCAIGEGAHICIGALIKAGCILAPGVKIEAGQVIMPPL